MVKRNCQGSMLKYKILSQAENKKTKKLELQTAIMAPNFLIYILGACPY